MTEAAYFERCHAKFQDPLLGASNIACLKTSKVHHVLSC